jgi:cell division transport system ATP-binding protein
MIQFTNVSKYYDGIVALKDISFTVEKGDMAFITGPSGAGKTTLLRLIYREEDPDTGQIVVTNLDVGNLRGSQIPELRRKVGVVFQNFMLLYNKTVFENVAIALRIHNVSKNVIKERTYETLKEVGLRHKADAYPQYLSGGEQQRVVIARAMVSSPPILLADEPTGNLDHETAEIIINLFKKINTRGTTVLLATHDPLLYVATGRKVIVLKEGKMVKEVIG